jgi:hypothetical protein
MRPGLVALLGLVLCTPSLAHAQRATERFIPVGQSPGVSGVSSGYGTIVGVYPAERRIEVDVAGSRESVLVPETTPIWIDGHAQGIATRDGSLDDVHPGRVVEVKYADSTRRVAAWVKLRTEQR